MKKYKVGYTQGTFDLFHVGHLNLINNAKKQCDYLIVGVNADDLVFEYKNKKTSINENDRARIVGSIKGVDDVIVATTLDKMEVYEQLKFDAIFIGDDWKGNERWTETENNFKKYGVDVVYLPHTDGISTTKINELIKSRGKNLDLSIIIPTYNCEKYISECLDSILKVKDDSFEVILVNDASNDSTDKICKEYSEKDKRIKYISNKKNFGVSNTRNIGIEKATGKWIMFVDSDDMLSDGWYDKIKEHFSSMNEIIYINSRISTKPKKDEMLDYIFNIKKNMYLANPFSKMYKTKFIKDNNLFFESKVFNGEDMLFNAQAMLLCNNYKFVTESIYKYRIVNTSITHSFNSKIFDSDACFHEALNRINETSKISLNKYIDYSTESAIYMFIRRLSFISFHEAKNYYDKIRKFRDSITIKNINDKDFMKKICLWLVQKDLIGLSIFMVKIKNFIRKIFLRKKYNSYFIEI